ncbi:peptide transporter ptr2 [Umbelopsis sp. WA50703]
MSEKIEEPQQAIADSEQVTSPAQDHVEDNEFGPEPTEEEWGTLREVADNIPISAFLVILIEFCERFTYYGLSGPFQNYIQYPAPLATPLISLVLSAVVNKLLLLLTPSSSSGVMLLLFLVV